MQKMHFSYLSIFAAVQATPDGLRSQLDAISFSSVADVLADTGIKTNIHRQQLRAGEGLLSTFAEVVDGYGCYCNMLGGSGGQVEKPHGVPADGLDAVCRGWHLANNCANIDAVDPVNICDIQTHEYTSVTAADPYQYINFVSFDPFTTEVNEDLIITNCQAANAGDDCAIQACNVDANFVVTVVAYFMESEVLGEIPQADTTCPEQEIIPPSRGGNGPMACCGTDAARFPYLTNGGQRGCCGSKTYDTAILQCCDESSSLIATTC